MNSVVHLVSAVFVSILHSACVVVLLTTVGLLRHVHLRPNVILRVCDDPSISNGSRKSPIQSHVRTKKKGEKRRKKMKREKKKERKEKLKNKKNKEEK